MGSVVTSGGSSFAVLFMFYYEAFALLYPLLGFYSSMEFWSFVQKKKKKIV